MAILDDDGIPRIYEKLKAIRMKMEGREYMKSVGDIKKAIHQGL